VMDNGPRDDAILKVVYSGRLGFSGGLVYFAGVRRDFLPETGLWPCETTRRAREVAYLGKSMNEVF